MKKTKTFGLTALGLVGLGGLASIPLGITSCKKKEPPAPPAPDMDNWETYFKFNTIGDFSWSKENDKRILTIRKTWTTNMTQERISDFSDVVRVGTGEDYWMLTAINTSFTSLQNPTKSVRASDGSITIVANTEPNLISNGMNLSTNNVQNLTYNVLYTFGGDDPTNHRLVHMVEAVVEKELIIDNLYFKYVAP